MARRCVSAAGNPALAMGGTGDLLAGIAGALLAQGLSPLHAGAAAAWVHGTAAERARGEHGGWRGVTMELLLHEREYGVAARAAPTALPTAHITRCSTARGPIRDDRTQSPTPVTLGPGREFASISRWVRQWGARAHGIGDDAAILDVPVGNTARREHRYDARKMCTFGARGCIRSRSGGAPRWPRSPIWPRWAPNRSAC